MRTILFAALMLIATGLCAQETRRMSYMTSLGTGVDMSRPSHTPFEWQMAACYNFNGRLSAGVGTGITVYEKALCPLFARVRYCFSDTRRLSPFVEGQVGYGIALASDANGGFMVNPAAGVAYNLLCGAKLFLAVGYEGQRLERLRKFQNDIISAEFAEELNHSVIAVRVGVEFGGRR